MKICYFGIYDPDYVRSKNLIAALKLSGHDVLEVNSRDKGYKKYFNLYRKHKKLNGVYDLMIVAFPGQGVMFLAKLICRKKIIFDAFLSLFDSNVCDRKLVKPRSFKARYYFFLDWMSCRFADVILVDTNEHAKYFVNVFGVKKEKIFRIFVGADERIFYPRISANKLSNFSVEWHGDVIPLHGIETILKASVILKEENISFHLIVGNKNFEKVKNLVDSLGISKSVHVYGQKSLEQLADFIVNSDVCLGIFGQTEKAKRVIPCKVFETLACQKTLISMDSPAIKELLVDGTSCLLVKEKDPKGLAEMILKLRDNKSLSENIAKGGYDIFIKKSSVKALSGVLSEVVNRFLKK